MDVALFIAKRIAFNRQKSFSRFIIRLAIAATALSVAAMIITIAFVTGFQQAVANKVFSFWGHIHVQEYQTSKALVAEETPLDKNDTVEHILRSLPQVKSVQAFATKSAVIENKRDIEGILIKGVDDGYNFQNLQPFLKEGKWLNFSDTLYSKDIVISQPLASELQIKLNDTVSVYFIMPDEGKSTLRRLRVCGIYKTGIEEYDKLFALADLRMLRRISHWSENSIGGYEIFLDDYKNIDTVNNLLYNKYQLPGAWISRSVKDIYPNIFDWLSIQDTNRNVIFVVMAIVAIINLITCLLILVLERTRMVGILKAIGTSDSSIQNIFLYYATIIAGIGVVTGFVLGVGLCLIQQYTGFLHLDESAYYVSVAPVKIVWWETFAVCGATLIVCFLSLILPALFVKRIEPVKAIQFK